MLDRGLTKEEIKEMPKGFHLVNMISYTDPETGEVSNRTINRKVRRTRKPKRFNNRKITKSRIIDKINDFPAKVVRKLLNKLYKKN